MKRRVLLFLVLMALLPLPGRAEAQGPVRTASFAIPSAWGSKTASLPLDDRWFLEDTTQYHHGLARISLAMAVSAFRGASGQEDKPIRAFLDQLGFSVASGQAPSIRTWDYAAAGPDTIATAIARRDLACLEAPVPLIAVAVCGGNYGEEWANNLDFGLTGDHAGFARAGRKIVERLRQFEQENALTGQRCVYWLCGYGRGGAVCQAAARLLEQEGPVCCYTFASPLTQLLNDDVQPSGVFNIVSASDPLSQLPPPAWGFSRYGRTLYLPSSLDRNHDYASLLSGFSAVFRQFSGREETLGDRDLAPMAAAAAAEIAARLGSRANYQAEYQSALLSVFTGKSLGTRDMLRAFSFLSAVSSAARSQQRYALGALPKAFQLGAFASRELSALYAQHDPAVYACWLLSLPQGNVLLDSSLTLTEGPAI